MFDATVSIQLTAERPGVPVPTKLQGDHAPLFDLSRPLDEETGARIAAYARGEEVKPRGEEKNIAIAEDLIAEFNAATTREKHMAIVEGNKPRLDWFRERRPELYERINKALTESFLRMKAQEAEGDDATASEPGDDTTTQDQEAA